MDIPWNELPPETLTALLEEFASREGTDYGGPEYSLEDKVGQLREQLRRGEAKITFDSATESCNLIPKGS